MSDARERALEAAGAERGRVERECYYSYWPRVEKMLAAFALRFAAGEVEALAGFSETLEFPEDPPCAYVETSRVNARALALREAAGEEG